MIGSRGNRDGCTATKLTNPETSWLYDPIHRAGGELRPFVLHTGNLPMIRYRAEPGDTGGFERDVRADATSNGTMDNGLRLLVEQRDQRPLRPDEPLDLAVRVIEKPDDGRLLVGRRGRRWDLFEIHPVETITVRNNSARAAVHFTHEGGSAEEI